jgi:hypothetical protein
MCLFSTYIASRVWYGSRQNVKVRAAACTKIKRIHNARATDGIAMLTSKSFELLLLMQRRKAAVNVTNGSDIL